MGRALLVIETPEDRSKAVSWIGKAPVGTRVEFKASKRTLPQNDMLWALLTEVSQQLSHGNAKYDPSQWKAIFLHAFGREVSFLPSLDRKTFLPLELSSSDLSKDEMTDFIEFIMKEAGERGVIFKDHRQTDNSNTGEQPPPSPGADDVSPSSSASAAGEDTPSPAASPAASIIECARDMLSMATLSYENDRERDATLQMILDQWEELLRDHQPQIDAISVAARAVATKSRTIEQAREYLAKTLKTTVEELGG